MQVKDTGEDQQPLGGQRSPSIVKPIGGDLLTNRAKRKYSSSSALMIVRSPWRMLRVKMEKKGMMLIHTSIIVFCLLLKVLRGGATCPSATPDVIGAFSFDEVVTYPNTDFSCTMNPPTIAGTCMAAMWVTDEDIIEEHIDDISLLTPLTFNYTTTGTFKIALYLSNNVSVEVAVCTIQVDSQIIEHDNTSVVAVQQDEISYLSLGVTSGSRFCMFVDWGDNIVEYYCRRDLSEVAPTGHVFDDVGFYTVHLTMSNIHGIIRKSMLAWVENPVKDLELTNWPTVAHLYPAFLPNSVIYVTLEASSDNPPPSFVNCSFINTADGEVIAIDSPDFDADLTQNISFSLGDLGYKEIQINCSNHISFQDDLIIQVEVEYAMAGITLTHNGLNWPLIPYGEMLDFTLLVQNGTNITVNINWGDNNAPYDYVPSSDPLSWEQPLEIEVSKSYSPTLNADGTLVQTITTTLYNAVSGTVTETWDVTVMVRYVDLTVTVNAISLPQVSYTFDVVAEPVLAGWEYSCIMDLPNGQSSSSGTGTSFSISPTFSEPGLHTVNVSCSNNVSIVFVTPTVEVRNAITGLTLNPIAGIVIATLTDHTFTVHIDEGSAVTIDTYCDYGNDPLTVTSSVSNISGPADVDLACQYAVTGMYVVNVTANNVVSQMDSTFSIEVQKGVDNIDFTSDSPLDLPPQYDVRLVTFTVSLPGPEYPTGINLYTDLLGTGTITLYDITATGFETGTSVEITANLPLGTHVPSVMVNNTLSELNVTTSVLIVQPMFEIGLGSPSGQAIFPALIPAEIYLLVTEGSHATFNVSFGDGNMVSLTPDDIPLLTSYTVTNTYTSTGDFPLSFEATNPIGQNLIVNVLITAVYPLVEENIEVIHPKLFAIQDSPLTVTVSDSITDPAEVATAVQMTIFTDNAAPSIQGIFSSWPITAQPPISYLGFYLPFGLTHYSMELTNIATTVYKNFTMFLSQRIENPIILGPSTVLAGVENIFSFAYDAGHNVTVNIDFGDGTSAELTGLQPLPYYKIYGVAGVYEINAIYSNILGDESALPHVVDIREALDLTCTSNAPVKTTEDLIISCALPLGRTTAFVAFEVVLNGLTVNNDGEMLVENGVHEIRLSVLDYGEHDLVINMNNIVSNQVYTEDISADHPISGLDFVIFSYENDTENGVIMYEPEVEIFLIGSYSGGSRVMFSYSVIGQPITANGLISTIMFENSGTFTIMLYANNSADSKNVTHTITISSPVGLLVYEQPDKIYLVDNLPIHMEFDFPKSKCMHFKFVGKTTQEWWYETRVGLCADRADGYTGQYVRHLDNKTIHDLMPLFDHPGKYKEILMMYTEDRSQEKIYELEVSRWACEKPKFQIPAGKPGKFIDDPWCTMLSDYIIVTSETMAAQTECREKSFFISQWALFKVTEEDPEGIEVNSSLVETHLPLYMDCQPRALPPGLYRVEFMLLMEGLEVFNNSDNYFIKVIPSPLKCGIVPDLLWQTGNTQPITMDAQGASMDPNTGSNQDLRYEWFCWRADEASLTVTDDPADDVNLDIIQVPTTPSSGTGCFGNGPGKLDITDGIFDFDPSFMALTEYIFTVRVSSGDQRSVCQQRLTIVDGQPLEVLIRRDTTDQCPYKYYAGGLLSFYADCLDCSNLDQLPDKMPEFDWKVLDLNGEEVNLGETKQVKVSRGGLGSELHLYHAPLLDGTEYRLRLHTKVVDGLYIDGLSEVILHTSSPPYGGNCSVEPRNVTFLETPVKINCVDWKDDDFAPGRVDSLVLHIMATVAGKSMKVVAERAFLPTGDPDNDYNVIVDIYVTDPCGSYTLETHIVQVLPINKTGMTEEQSALEYLKNLDSEGMRLESSVICTAALAIMFTFDLSDSENEALQRELLSVFSNLLLAGAEYSGAAGLAMTDAVERLSLTMSADTNDQSVEVLFNLAGSLASDLGKQKTVAATEQMVSGLTSIAASCLGVQAGKQAAIAAAPPLDQDAIPDPLEEASPEEQQQVAAEKNAKLKEKLQVLEGILVMVQDIVISQAANQHHDVIMGNPDFQIGFTMCSMESLAMTIVEISKMTAQPEYVDINAPCANPAFRSSYVNHNLYEYASSSKDVSGRISSMRMYCTAPGDARRKKRSADGAPQPVDVYGRFLIKLQMNADDRLEVNLTEAVIDVNTSMVYFTLPVEHDTFGFILEFEPDVDEYNGQTVCVFIMLKAKEEYIYKPTQRVYNIKACLPRNTTVNPWSVVIPENVDVVPLAYIGVLFINETYNGTKPNDQNVKRKKRSTAVNDESNNSTGVTEEIVPDDMILKNASALTFRVFATLATCRSWDTIKEQWVLETCGLANDSTTTDVNCACTESTAKTNSISPGFSPPGINTIDFSKVFGNFAALLAGNPAVFAVVVITLILYILLLVWARRADVGDLKKWTTQPLIDNVPEDQYLYHITVVTGMRSGGGTKSNIRFIISGEDGDSGIRKLDDQYNRGFPRGSSRGFMMSTAAPLGQLTYFRVWHDNSGRWSNKSWYLDKIIVEDMKTQETFFFLCDRWLAVDEDDGQLERVLPIAGREQILETKNLFYISSRKKLTDEHLWVSVFARPERNTFTRAQRLTSGVALLFITMIANAMWYREPDEAANDTMVKIGPITLSLDILYISVMSSLTSIPVSTMIILFFQKARPKPVKPGQPRTGLEPPRSLDKHKEDLTKAEALEVKKYKRKFPLPWWFVVIAWVLAVLTILGAAFFVILYSLDWGKVKAEGWLSAFFLCFFENIFIIQPAKVVAVALLISCICKTIDQEDEEKNVAELEEKKVPENEVMSSVMLEDLLPMKKSKLARAQYIGLREKRMWQNIQELIFHFLFLILIMYLAWGSRSSGSDFLIKRSVLGMLKSEATGDFMSVDKVSDGHKMWQWIRETLLPNIYWQKQYTGDPTPRWARVYINDQVTIRLGTVRLRQLRIEKERCSDSLPELICRPDYGIFTQQDRHFVPGWTDYINETQKDNVKSRLERAFVYQSFIDLQNIPYIGIINTYGGGGYVAELGHGSVAAEALIHDLIDNDWVDKRTRAVFFETTIYNVNVHLFASIIVLFEFPSSGGVLPRIHVDTFNAYAGVGTQGTVTLVMMVLFVLVLIVMAVFTALKIKEDHKTYFNDPWNIVEVVFFFMAFVCVGMYGTKEAYTRYITEKINEDKDANIGYMQLSTYEIGYNAVVGITVFIITCKTLKLLNFEKHVRDLALSLRLIRQDLLSFVLVFTCIYMAFAMFGLVVFGRHMFDYSSFIKSLESLFSTLLGKFDYHGLYQVSRHLGPMFIILYALAITFVLINMFIGIVTAAFEEAKFDISTAFDGEVWEYLKYKILVLLRLRKPEVEEEPIDEDESSESEEECPRGPKVIPEAMKPEQRAALHSLDIHLHFLDSFVDHLVKKRKVTVSETASATAGDTDECEQTEGNDTEKTPHFLDAYTSAVLWDDMPDSLLEMMVKSARKGSRLSSWSLDRIKTQDDTTSEESGQAAISPTDTTNEEEQNEDVASSKSSLKELDPSDLMDARSETGDSVVEPEKAANDENTTEEVKSTGNQGKG